MSYEPHDDDLEVIRDLVKRRILTGLEWAGEEWTECLIPFGIEDFKYELHSTSL